MVVTVGLHFLLPSANGTRGRAAAKEWSGMVVALPPVFMNGVIDRTTLIPSCLSCGVVDGCSVVVGEVPMIGGVSRGWGGG